MADENIPSDAVEFKLVLAHNVVTRQFSMSGHMQNLLVARGMLRYADQLVSMEIAKARMMEEMQNAPRVHLSNRVVS